MSRFLEYVIAHHSHSLQSSNAGNPSPRLTWWREHALIDDSFEVLNGATVNALRIPAVRNTDLNAVFVCQAVNNNMSFPVSTSLRMDISCKLSWLSLLGGVPGEGGLIFERFGIAFEIVEF